MSLEPLNQQSQPGAHMGESCVCLREAVNVGNGYSRIEVVIHPVTIARYRLWDDLKCLFRLSITCILFSCFASSIWDFQELGHSAWAFVGFFLVLSITGRPVNLARTKALFQTRELQFLLTRDRLLSMSLRSSSEEDSRVLKSQYTK